MANASSDQGGSSRGCEAGFVPPAANGVAPATSQQAASEPAPARTQPTRRQARSVFLWQPPGSLPPVSQAPVPAAQVTLPATGSQSSPTQQQQQTRAPQQGPQEIQPDQQTRQQGQRQPSGQASQQPAHDQSSQQRPKQNPAQASAPTATCNGQNAARTVLPNQPATNDLSGNSRHSAGAFGAASSVHASSNTAAKPCLRCGQMEQKLNSQQQSFERQLERERRQSEEHDRAIRQHEAAADRLRQQLAELEEQERRSANQRAELEQQLEDKRQELLTVRGQLVTLEETGNLQRHEMEANLADAVQRATKHEADFRERQRECERLQAELAAKDKQLQNANQCIEIAKSDVKTLRTEREELLETKRHLQEQLQAKHRDAEAVGSSLKESKHEQNTERPSQLHVREVAHLSVEQAFTSGNGHLSHQEALLKQLCDYQTHLQRSPTPSQGLMQQVAKVIFSLQAIVYGPQMANGEQHPQRRQEQGSNGYDARGSRGSGWEGRGHMHAELSPLDRNQRVFMQQRYSGYGSPAHYGGTPPFDDQRMTYPHQQGDFGEHYRHDAFRNRGYQTPSRQAGLSHPNAGQFTSSSTADEEDLYTSSTPQSLPNSSYDSTSSSWLQSPSNHHNMSPLFYRRTSSKSSNHSRSSTGSPHTFLPTAHPQEWSRSSSAASPPKHQGVPQVYKEGQQVGTYLRNDGEVRVGTVRFFGPLKNGNPEENFVGLEMDEEIGGSGETYDGHTYFTCKQGHGALVVASKVFAYDLYN